MARKKKGGHTMPAWRKWTKTAINLLFKAIGIAAIAAPAGQAISHAVEIGSVSQLGIDALYNYTGVNVPNKSFDWGQTLVGIGSVAGGLFLFWVGGQAARHV